ncbi:hypothetical protein GSI_12143 [Ganoderma sinense ZZ0214-1]|uniref:Uncharacterized protein n=1 Tax=Ganoderma sinense ZZ0214-1 TaxID=1077348 RepID=A0A2G8RXZ5_9APHY|nr:hypothetical protein GSI_12143 [Ganoderma sinense ZZ0214-1]
MLLIAAVFSSFLVPSAIVLFVFSTPALRRRPHFILNLCAIALGLTQGSIFIYVTIMELQLNAPSPTLISVITALCIVGPICVQTILFLRVLAVYPPHQQSVLVRYGVYGPAVAMKLARVVNAAYLLYIVQRGNGAKTIAGQSAAVWGSPFAKSELSLQLLDDVYVSTLFLLKIHTGVRFSGKQLRRHSSDPQVAFSQGSYGARLQTLFWIALSNFVFPVIFDVAQLVLIFRNPNYVEGSYVIIVNSYVSILGVLFSTIWASGATQLRVGDASSAECGCGYGYSIRPPGHTTSYSASLSATASHLPLPPKPVRPNAHTGSSLIVPPEVKVRFGSRSDLETVSGEAEYSSSEEGRFVASPRIELAARHPYATAVSVPTQHSQ